MINKKILIIFASLIFQISSAGNNRYNNPSDDMYNLMKQTLKSGSSCLTGDLYDFVRKSNSSMKYYCEYVCTAYRGAKDPNYIKNRYGTKAETLGSGSFGIVYLYNRKDGEKFAIKIPKSFKFQALFEELNSSNCIREKVESSTSRKLLGYIRECITPPGESPHLVMYFYSESLEDKMKRVYSKNSHSQSYPLDLKKNLFRDMYYLAHELKSLHDVGLAHRDLKPENAMINDADLPILVDFGLTTPNLTNARTVCGSPLFMDPELITYKTTGGANADIYALGIMFYIMMVGDDGWNRVDDMVIKGGYGTQFYNPNFSKLNLTGDRAFIMNMLVSSKKPASSGGRWKIDQVLETLKSMFQNLNNPEQNVTKTPEYQKQPSQVTTKPTTNINYKYYKPVHNQYGNGRINYDVQIQPRVIKKQVYNIINHQPVRRVVHQISPYAKPVTRKPRGLYAPGMRNPINPNLQKLYV